MYNLYIRLAQLVNADVLFYNRMSDILSFSRGIGTYMHIIRNACVIADREKLYCIYLLYVVHSFKVHYEFVRN